MRPRTAVGTVLEQEQEQEQEQDGQVLSRTMSDIIVYHIPKNRALASLKTTIATFATLVAFFNFFIFRALFLSCSGIPTVVRAMCAFAAASPYVAYSVSYLLLGSAAPRAIIDATTICA